jgi:hypothetical protein
MTGLQDIGDLGFYGLMGILIWLQLFFRYLETTYPPILKCFDSNGGKKIVLMYHHLEDMGGFDFSVSGWFSLCFTEFESLDNAVHKVAWGYQKPKKVHS